MGAKYLAFNLIFHSKIKHIKVYYHFVIQQVAKKLLDIDLMPIEDQAIDNFMKSLTVRMLENFKRNINLKRCDWGRL